MIFARLGVYASLSDGRGIWEHLHSSREVECLQVISRLYGWVYKTLILNPLLVEHRVVVVTAGFHQDDSKLNPMGSQFSIPDFCNLSSELVRSLNFEILVKDSNTGGQSSVFVRVELLFAFQFWYCELYVKTSEGEAGSIFNGWCGVSESLT